MGNTFSRNPVKLTKHDTTLIEMKTKCRELKAFIRNLEERISAQNKAIRALASQGKQSAAINVLKYRKTLEATKEKSESSLFNLKELIDKVELAQLEAEVFKSLKQGSLALQAIQKEMPIDKIEKLMDDIADGVAQQKDISLLLGGSVMDDDSLSEELAVLESELAKDLEASLPNVPFRGEVNATEITNGGDIKEESLDLPDAPSTELRVESLITKEVRLEPTLSS